jgi:hypothetical protein
MNERTNKLCCVTNGKSSVTDNWKQLEFRKGGGTDKIRKVAALNRIFGEPGETAPVVEPQ